MQTILKYIRQNNTPLIIGLLIGVIIGGYSTSNNTYRIGYEKPITKINDEDIEHITKLIKKLRNSIDDEVIGKLNKIDVRLSEVSSKVTDNKKASIAAIEGNANAAISAIEEYAGHKKDCNCNKARNSSESQEGREKDIMEENTIRGK